MGDSQTHVFVPPTETDASEGGNHSSAQTYTIAFDLYQKQAARLEKYKEKLKLAVNENKMLRVSRIDHKRLKYKKRQMTRNLALTSSATP